MARVYADRVLETTTSTGTGDITLAGAATGYADFASACDVGDTFDYAIFAVDGSGVPTGAWETGLGTYSAASTLTRTAVQASSNSDALVSFASGTKFVILSHNAASIEAGGGGATATVNRAADLSFTVDQTGLDFSTINTVNFNKSDFDDFDGAISGSLFVVPAGVERIELQIKLWAANLAVSAGAFLNLTVYSPSRAVYIGAVNLPVTAAGKIMAVTLPSMEVVEGETFEVRIQGDAGQTNVQINANGTAFVLTDVSPITVGGGGGGGGGGNPEAPWTVPVLADFSAVNLGTVTLADSPAGIGIRFPTGNGFGVRGIMQAAPATPWTVYAKIDFSMIAGEGNSRFGLAVRNTTTGRIIQFGFQNYSDARKQISRERWNGVNSYNGQDTAAYYEGDKPWLKLENDGTNLNFSIGDGYNWLPVATTTLAAFVASVDEVGVLIQNSFVALAVVNSFSFTAPA